MMVVTVVAAGALDSRLSLRRVLQICLELRKVTLRLAQITGRERLAQCRKVGLQRILRRPGIRVRICAGLAALLQTRVGFLCTGQIAVLQCLS